MLLKAFPQNNFTKQVLFAVSLFLFFNSCRETPKKVVIDTTPEVDTKYVDTLFEYSSITTDSTPSKRVPIGNTGLTIDLPLTHKIDIQKGNDFMVYYFTPIDTTVYHGEGGMYVGPKPDEHPPTSAFTKTIIAGTFLGVKTNWIAYKTANYMQTETFIDSGQGQKIHVWYYATDLVEMARLLKVIRSISR